MSEVEPADSNEPVSFRFGVLRLLILLLLLLVLYLFANFTDVWVASRADLKGPAPAAIVLGAAQYNGEPSPVLRARLDRALDLYKESQVDLVVVTGGGQVGDVTTEAKTGYDYLRAAGIPDEALLLEVQGLSTYESVGAAARILRRRGISEAILVTDSYHSRRAQLVAEEFGMDAQVALVGSPSVGRLLRESVAVSIGRITSFRRLDWYQD